MSFFQSQIGLKPLAALCRRLSTALGAGVDARTVLAREATAARGLGRGRFRSVSDDVAGGTSISESVGKTGEYFPQFFRELVKVGEESGHLPEVLRRLAEHYEHQLRLRRTFLAAITWPTIELTVALVVVGALIWAMGAIPQLSESKVDLLGFGLTGNSGLVTYLGFLAVVGLVLYIVVRATSRGVLWVAPVQRVIMSIPRLGRTIETLALARMAWALHVTLNSGMELRKALAMAMASTHNVVYTRHIDRVLGEIRQGHEIHEALTATGAFPIEFIDTVQVGEQSGRLVESMGHLSEQYQDQARLAMNTLTILFGLGVWMLMAGILVFLIFRLAGSYANIIIDLTRPNLR